MRRVTVVLAVSAALVGGLAAAPGAESRGNGIQRMATLETDVLSAVNATRAARGLRQLEPSQSLRTAAAAHSRAMVEQGFFQHESSDGTPFDQRVRRFYPTGRFSFWSVGENLLYTTAELDPAAAVKAWLASPGHRRNLLSSQWREAGVGVVRATAAGGVFGGSEAWVVTMDFGARGASPERSTLGTVAESPSR